MATNADDILKPDELAGNTASDDLMNKHFEAAGITDEPSTAEENTDASAKAGSDKEAKGEGDKKPEGDKADSNSGGKDGASERNAKPEAKKKEGDTPNPGDLKLDDGTVVKGGAERRYYEQHKLERQRNSDLTNQLKQMTSSRDSWQQRFKDQDSTIRNTQGASADEVKTGLAIARDLKSDPVGTMRKLLAECVAAGYTVEGIGAGVDTAAITRMLETRLPAQHQPNGPTEQEIDQQAQQEVNQFYSQFPDARVHEATLARVLTDHPQLTLGDAYYQLKGAFIERGYDWSKPLQAQGSGESNQSTKETTDNTKPMPNGRQVADATDAGKVTVASPSTSTDDIIRQSMRDAGLKI